MMNGHNLNAMTAYTLHLDEPRTQQERAGEREENEFL